MRRFVLLAVVATAVAAAVAGCTIGGDCVIGLVDCYGTGLCTSLASDDYNCGACGHACPNGTFCSNAACTTARGTPIIRSVSLPFAIDSNDDGTHTLHLTVWFTDDSAMVDSFDFQSSAATLQRAPIPAAYTGSATVTINLPATAPKGTFPFTIDVAAGSVASAPFSDAVVLR